MADEYTCDVCGETFSSRVDYERHLTAAHPVGTVGEAADVDDIGSLRDEGSVRDTSQVSGRGETEGRGEVGVGDWMMGKNDVPRRTRRPAQSAFRCAYCGEEFEDQDELIAHVDSTHQRGEMTA